MKNTILFVELLFLSILLLLMPSCSEEACDGVVCQNGGTCVEGNCDCPPGFSGPFCEVEDLCFGLTCENGGNCVDGACECPPGFSGVNCEIEDLCFNVVCENDGNCIDGTCDCPEDYVGTRCESLDPTKVQAFLDAGRTPIELYNGNIPLDSLYGKIYAGGLIFYLRPIDGTGMVASFQNQVERVEWGCYDIDLPELGNVPSDAINPETFPGARIRDGVTNTDGIIKENCRAEAGGEIAAKLCRDLGEEWFLPSIIELELMYRNLFLNGYGNFSIQFYWSSTESTSDRAWRYNFKEGISGTSNVTVKAAVNGVRAVRAF